MKRHLLLLLALTAVSVVRAQMPPRLAQMAEKSGLTKCDVTIQMHGQYLEDTGTNEQAEHYSKHEHHFRRREWNCSFTGVCFIAPPTPDMPHKGDTYTSISLDKDHWVSGQGGMHYTLNAGSQYEEQSELAGTKTSKSYESAAKDSFTYDVRLNMNYTNDKQWSFSCGYEPGPMTRQMHREWKNVYPKEPVDQGAEDEHPTVHDGFSWTTMWTFKGETNPIRVIKKDGSFEIDVNLNGTRHAGNTLMTCMATVTIRPTQGNYLAYIEPVGGMDAYKKWLPEGNIKDSLRKPGNNTAFRVYVVKRTDTATHLDGLISKVVYNLRDVSNVPGVCMNYPAKHIDQKADLSFDNPLLAGAGGGNPYDKEVMELKFNGKASATVDCFDFGAYGTVSAKVTLTNGQELIAHCKADNRDLITIPYRTDEGSHVSDYWKQQNKADGMKDDEDQDKMGDGVGEQYPGDGYSVYEEYRGFREKEIHIRTDPGKADLLIMNKVATAGRAQDGINLYMGVTGIVVHSAFREEEFGEDKEEPGLNDSLAVLKTGFRFMHDKIMNFNHDRANHLHDQYGLLMVTSPLNLGYAEAVSKVDLPGTPKNIFFLVISADFKADPSGWANTKGIVDTTKKAGHDVTGAPAGQAKIITDEYASTIAHEMLHCSHVLHHGDGKDYEKFELIPGKTLGPGADSNAVYSSNDYSPVRIRWDDTGQPISGTDPYWRKHSHLTVVVGGQGGTASGFEDCIMRYDDRNAYLYTDGEVYVIKRPDGYYAELTGIQLCDSGKGTGVNDKHHDPRPRYGNATTNGCKQQVCINDKYGK